MGASEEVCAGIYTLLCMLGPLIKREHEEKKECEQCDQEVKLWNMLKTHQETKHRTGCWNGLV